MNGRIYDPTLGRFLQADPHIQAPNNSQSYNRYSYVLNNPQSYTDPSGYFFKKLWNKVKPFIGTILAVVVAVYCPACIATFSGAAWTGGTIGAISAAANGGNILKGAITGALAGAAFQQIGANFNGAEGSGFFAEGGLGHIATHGVTGGVMSVLQGGKFGHGFLSAGLTKALNINKVFGVNPKDAGLRVTAAAVVGGTISKLSGGKFANGAISSAFAQMFNGESYAKKKWNQIQTFAKKMYASYKENDLTLSYSLTAKVPGFVARLVDAPINNLGINIGAAWSTDGDTGITFSLISGNSDGISVGKLSLDMQLNTGKVSDMAGKGYSADIMAGVAGGVVSYDGEGNFTGGGIQSGIGLEASGSETKTWVLSKKGIQGCGITIDC